jgi:DNA-binding transcriptional MerR regulator
MSDINIDTEPRTYKELKTVDLAKMFEIAESTVRKYAQELEKAGYVFAKDATGTRIFRDTDQLVFIDLIKFRKDAGVSLEMAASIAATRRTKNEVATHEVQPTQQKDLTVLDIQHKFQHLSKAYDQLVSTQEEILKELTDSRKYASKQDDKIEMLLRDNQEFKSKLDIAVEYIQKQEDLDQNKKKSLWKKIFG